VYVISGGRVIGEGTPSALETSDSAMVRQFLGGRPDGPVPFHYPAMSFEKELFDEC